MRIYCKVKDVLPPDKFQPRTAITVVDKDGGEFELLFDSSDQIANAASTLADVSMEADLPFRDLMREHFERARDFDDTKRDDYEWPEGVAS